MTGSSQQPGASEPQDSERPFLWPADLGVRGDWLVQDMGLHRLWKALVAENYHPVLAAFNSGDPLDPAKAVHRERLYALLAEHLAHRATKSPPHQESCLRLAQILELQMPTTAVRDRYRTLLLGNHWININAGPEEMLADADTRHRMAWAEAAVAQLTEDRRRALLTATIEPPRPDLLSDTRWVPALETLQKIDAMRISPELIVSAIRSVAI